MSNDLIELINENPGLFGSGIFYGFIVYMIISTINCFFEGANYYREKRKKLKEKDKVVKK